MNVLAIPAYLRRRLPAVCAGFLTLALLLLPSVGRAQTVAFNGIVTTEPATGLSQPFAVAVDGAGNVFIADTGNSRVLKVTPAGGVTTVDTSSLPSTTIGASAGCSSIGICYPLGVAADEAGDVFIADSGHWRVVEVTAAGVATVLDTSALPGTTNVHGCPSNGVCRPYGMAADAAGDLYIADFYNQRLVEVTAAGVASVVNLGTPGGVPVTDFEAVAIDQAGDLFVFDDGNNRLVELSAANVASVVNVGAPGGIAVNTSNGLAVDDIGETT